MIVVSQDEAKTTESLEFEIKEIKTCKNVIIPKKQWEKFRKITQKENDYIGHKELIGLGEFLEQNLMKSLYAITETKRNQNFGVYSTKEKAKKVLRTIIKEMEKQKSYVLPKDISIGMIL